MAFPYFMLVFSTEMRYNIGEYGFMVGYLGGYYEKKDGGHRSGTDISLPDNDCSDGLCRSGYGGYR